MKIKNIERFVGYFGKYKNSRKHTNVRLKILQYNSTQNYFYKRATSFQ